MSASELAEIKESEKEFAAKTAPIYDNSAELLKALHSEREKAQNAKKKSK